MSLGLIALPGAEPAWSQDSAPAARDLAAALSVQADARCLEKTRLVEQIALWLDGTRLSPDLRVIVYGDARDPHSLVFDIKRGDRTRRRAFKPSPERCEDVHAVLGLAIALALDGERLQQLLLDPHPVVLPARVRLASLQASAAHQLLPKASLGAQLGTELGVLDWFSARLDAFGQGSWDDRIEGSTGRFDVLLFAGSVQGCAGGRLGAGLRVALCAGGAAGAQHAWGKGYAPASRGTAGWLALRSGLRIEARLGLPWLLDLDMLSPMIAAEYQAVREEGPSLTRESAPTGFMLSLGPAVGF